MLVLSRNIRFSRICGSPIDFYSGPGAAGRTENVAGGSKPDLTQLDSGVASIVIKRIYGLMVDETLSA